MFAPVTIAYWYLVLFAHGVGGATMTTVPHFFFTFDGCETAGKAAIVKMEKIVPHADYMCIAAEKR